MDDDKRTLDELIAELNQMRGRIDILRKLANALIQDPTRQAGTADDDDADPDTSS